MTTEFSSMQTRRWSDIFKALRKINCQPRILYPIIMYPQNEGKIKMFSDEQKLRIHCQQICSARNVKVSSLREIWINTKKYQALKMVKMWVIFFIFLISLKDK